MFHCVPRTSLRRIYSPVSNNHQELFKQTFSNLCYRLHVFYNLGIYIADNFMKLCEIGFAMECITGDFSQFFSKTVKFCLLFARRGTCHQFLVFKKFS